jgi:hypothetical protein
LSLALAAGALLYVCGVASARSGNDGLTINVVYSATSLQATLSNGSVLSSGAVVPPGPYSIVVYDSGSDQSPQFTVSGPGAEMSSDLNPSGTGIEVPIAFGPFVLQPSSSYEISDASMTASAGISFTTSATGSSVTPGQTTTTTAGASPSPSGLKTAGTLGTLTLTVGANGKPVFAFAGKPVKTLKTGKYSLFVGDLSKKAGALIGHGKARPSTLSSAAAVGVTSHTLELTSGKWFVEASTKGPKIYFTVK